MKRQLTEHISIEELGDNSSILYTSTSTEQKEILFNTSGISIDGVILNDGTVSNSSMGTAATPVARTNSPIVGANLPNVNIDLLDAAIGADNSIVARTYSPTVVNTSLNAKVTALDAAIGGDPIPYVRTVGAISASASVNDNINDLDSIIGPDIVPVARTIGAISMATHIMANLGSIDTGIGTDAQMPDSSINVDHDLTIYQNLRALDTYKTVRTVKVRVGNIGVANSDLFFASAADANEQPIDLGEILPAKCRLMDVMVFTDSAFTNLGALTTDVGLTSGTGDLIGAANNTAANAIMATANAGAFIATPSASAQHVWLNVKPTNNWDSANPVGRMSVYVTFIDLTNV